MVILRTITARREGKSNVFRCVMNTLAGDMELDVTAAELESYYAFQHVVLNRLGVLYRYEAAEGRPAELADHFWRTEFGYHLQASLNAMNEAAGMN